MTAKILDFHRVQSARMLADSRLSVARDALIEAAVYGQMEGLTEEHALLLRSIRDAAVDLLRQHDLYEGKP